MAMIVGLLIGSMVGWFALAHRVAGAVGPYLKDDITNEALDLADDVGDALLPGPLKTLWDRHYDRKTGRG